MVALRFGSLHDFRFPVRSYSRVADLMRCWPVNVYYTIQRFIKNDYQHPPDGRKDRKVRPEITETMIENITSWKRMQEWSHLGMRSRAELLKRMYPLHRFNRDCLNKIYKQAGITFTKRQ